MAKQKINGRFEFNEPVPAANVNLLEARAFKGKDGKAKGEAKYGVTLILDPASTDLKAAQALAVSIAKDAFPGLALKDVRFPFKDGTKENARRVAKGLKALDWQQGKVVLGIRSKDQPRLAGVVSGRIVDFDSDEQITANGRLFYNGVKVCVQVNFASYGEAAAVGDDDNDAKPGITAYLNLVLSTGSGSRISGSVSAAEAFRGFSGSLSATDPTAGATPDLGDDEIPF